MIEIKVIGRGGQGGKTAAYILALAAFRQGYEVQSFPEFGPEREGAPVFSYTRISKEPIKVHFGIKNPDAIIVIDPSLIYEIDILEGIKKGGKIIINSKEIPKTIAKKVPQGCELYYVDATRISIEFLGKNMPNTPILGAFSKVFNMLSFKMIADEFKEEFKAKLSEQSIEKNINSMKKAFDEVKRA